MGTSLKFVRSSFLARFHQVTVGLVAAAATLVGCGSRTVITSVTFFPASATAQTATYTLIVEAKGELGKAYTDYGTKGVNVILKGNLASKDGNSATRQYTLNASNLEWVVVWTNFDNIQIDFTDHDSRAKLGTLVFSPAHTNFGLKELSVTGLKTTPR